MTRLANKRARLVKHRSPQCLHQGEYIHAWGNISLNNISIHASVFPVAGAWWLVEEVDNSKHTNHSLFAISTHDLAKRSTLVSEEFDTLVSFQLTISQRGRLLLWCVSCWLILNFNSRPHEEVDLAKRPSTIPIIVFQLTTSRRGRRNTIKALLPPSYFNSRPREEVDVVSKVLDATCSSFQLTTSQGGRPLDNWWLDHIRCISTHDLTRRSTPETVKIVALDAFQLTTSRRGRRKSVLYPPFSGSFQLTTSQGGRLPLPAPCPITRYFNSRPHEEVDGRS